MVCLKFKLKSTLTVAVLLLCDPSQVSLLPWPLPTKHSLSLQPKPWNGCCVAARQPHHTPSWHAQQQQWRLLLLLLQKLTGHQHPQQQQQGQQGRALLQPAVPCIQSTWQKTWAA
jgi:hypothetical protein